MTAIVVHVVLLILVRDNGSESGNICPRGSVVPGTYSKRIPGVKPGNGALTHLRWLIIDRFLALLHFHCGLLWELEGREDTTE